MFYSNMTNIMRLSYPDICHGNSQRTAYFRQDQNSEIDVDLSLFTCPGHVDREKTPMLYSPNFPQSPEAQQSVLIYVKAEEHIISINQGMGQHPASLLF